LAVGRCVQAVFTPPRPPFAASAATPFPGMNAPSPVNPPLTRSNASARPVHSPPDGDPPRVYGPSARTTGVAAPGHNGLSASDPGAAELDAEEEADDAILAAASTAGVRVRGSGDAPSTCAWTPWLHARFAETSTPEIVNIGNVFPALARPNTCPPSPRSHAGALLEQGHHA